MKTHRVAFSLLSLVALAAFNSSEIQSASAQRLDPASFQELHWRMIGPFRGGRALAVSGVRGQRDVYYFGGVDGGVWKTTNGGITWSPIFDDQPVASVGALAVAASDPNILYVGTGEADMRSNISLGRGVYKSADAGKTWQAMGLVETRQIARIVVDPQNPDIVLVAALGHAYGPNPERGVFRSADGGKSWQRVLYKDENTGAIDLAIDPSDSKTVYAALWQARRPPWSVYPPMGGPGGGLYKSTDGGLHWKQLSGNGLPSGQWGRIGIAVSPVDSGKHVYALIENKDGGLFRSDDSGENWRRVGTDARVRGRAWYFSEVISDPKDAGTVYLPNVSLYRSKDGGKTFVAFKGAPGGDDYHSLWIDPDDPKRMILGSDQGVSTSVDGGDTWSSWYNQPTAQFYHVVTDNQFPYKVYGAQQDSGTIVTASRSDYGSITFRDWNQTGGGEAGYIAPDPSDPNIVYSGDTYGTLRRFDRRTGQQQEISPSAVSSFGTTIAQRDLRFTWTSPVVFSPQDSHVLYMGSQYVLRTADRGMSWRQVSPDLTGCDPKQKLASGAVTVENAKARCYGVVYTIAPSAVSAGTIWAGTDTGLIQLTRDDGKNWTNVTPPELSDWSKISIIDASPHDAGTAYAAVDRHRLEDVAPYAYRTHDFGKTWTQITAGIEAPAYVNVVREDPIRKGLLFAGTEMGVYVSFDDGDRWQPLQLNLPAVSVRDLVVHGDDLVIASHGRSFWILDDITPLRQINAETMNAGAFLFSPQNAFRVRRSVSDSTPLPPEFPAGENPPAGAMIDYWLKQPSERVAVEIRDSQGALVRRFSSDDPQVALDATAPFVSSWLRPAAPLSKAKGMHRLVWDLRYPSQPALFHEYTIAAAFGQDTPAMPEGALALPGRYEVRLMADGKILTQPLELKMDPRATTARAELEKQFALAQEITQTAQESYAAIQQIERLRAQLQDTGAKLEADAKQKALSSRVKSLESKLAEIEGRGQPPTTEVVQQAGLAKLNGNFASLEEATESADAAPTTQIQAAFAVAQQELSARLEQWKQVQQHDLVALNNQLTAQKLAPIAVTPAH